jgi:hypothetical protein
MIDRTREFEPEFAAQAELLKEKAIDAAAVARERLLEGSHAIKEYTVKQPAKALAIALGAGVLLGWIIKRR